MEHVSLVTKCKWNDWQCVANAIRRIARNKQNSPLLGNRLCARAFRSRCQHRKFESQPRARIRRGPKRKLGGA
jgi:hypothetical protein